MSFPKLRVVAVFSLGYFISYLFRGVNLGFAPYLSGDLGLNAHDLGTLTSVYFLGFAGAQVPAGVLLGRYGPRRVTAAVLLIAAAGSLIFAFGDGMFSMTVARLLIGVGASVTLSGAFKATAQHFPTTQITLANGIVMALGGLGGVAVGAPLSWLLTVSSWRAISIGLAAATACTAAIMLLGAPDSHYRSARSSMPDQLRGTALILRSRVFWKMVTFSGSTQAVFYAMQSFWIDRFLRDVTLLNRLDAAGRSSMLVSTLGAAFIIGNLGFGALARTMERYGVSVQTFSGATMVVFVVVQTLLAMHAPVSDLLLCVAYGAFGCTGVLTYTVLAERFPAHLTGRVNTTFTLVMFTGIFVFQIAIGAVLGQLPVSNGHYPERAHQLIWAALVVCQAAGAVWYFWPERQPALLYPSR